MRDSLDLGNHYYNFMSLLKNPGNEKRAKEILSPYLGRDFYMVGEGKKALKEFEELKELGEYDLYKYGYDLMKDI